ncbi:cadmium-translocating P-type ATPase [Clostridia bacterium]|nr:cadmium-translocating P-type ATPase [Clostridia bacterium]
MIAGAAVFVAGIAASYLFDLNPYVRLAVFLVAYVILGGETLLTAARNIAKGQVFDENFLMGVATLGAFAIGEYPEGVAVMLFYRIGALFERIAVGRSRRSITALMDIRPDFANLKTDDGGVRRVSPGDVPVGARIVVRPGERVPLDGVVEDGASAVDVSALTGEAVPVDVAPGSAILSGSISKNGLLTVRVTKIFSESTVSKILELTQHAGERKSRTESFITRFARYYTPAVVGAAAALAILPPLILPGARFSEWLARALVFLVVSCPCALVISVPLGFFGGIGRASRSGILVKGGNYLEALANIDTVVFDKTGTLTKGAFSVTETVPVAGMTADELLRLAAHAESGSTHPIALSIQAAYGKPLNPVSEVEETAGQGIKVRFEGRTITAGSARLLEGVPHRLPEAPGTVVYLAVDGVYAGHIVIADTVKPDSRRAVDALKRAGVREVVMLTGDSRAAAEAIATELGLDRFYAELLPHQKVERLEELKRGRLVFVGDGINDAPALALADVGVAMGGVGSDAAIEAADVVLMTDEPSALAEAVRIARRTKTIVWQNVLFALGVKAAILILGALGIANMWSAVFGDVGVTVIAILNAARVMRG